MSVHIGMDWDTVTAAIEAVGFACRGGLHPGPDDGASPGTGTLVLAGNAGPEMWRAFAAARATGATPAADPLDGWARERLSPVAGRLNARLLFPFDGPPFLPFQRWARKADTVFVSPLGLLIHPRWGLWHGYRGALVFAERIPLPPRPAAGHPCAPCADRPCLAACPVRAFTAKGYDARACTRHLRRRPGGDCMAFGCRARRACPVGGEHVFPPDQAAFHMRGFLATTARTLVAPDASTSTAPALI
jgi:hypothetical protein